MQLTVFGANGKVGSLVVAEALQRGYIVIAFVHSKSNFDNHHNLKILQGDIYDTASVGNAIKGSQTVISALGSWGTPKKDVLTVGMRHTIPIMKKNKITRLVSLTGSGANAPGDHLSLVDKTLHGLMDLVAHKILEDSEEHIRLLGKSNLDWTVVRSPVMNQKGQPKFYKLGNKRPPAWATINRHAVAQAMVDLVESGDYRQQSPFITR
jgi:putative NADH-flavin reductase